MAQTIRVSLPGYNALTDNNPDRFALYADQDWVLIKEKVRGNIYFKSSDYPSGYPITHSLGYVPFFLVFVKDMDNYSFYGAKNMWLQCGNANLQIAYSAYSNNNTLYLIEATNVTTPFYYYIFYDNIVGSSNQSIIQSDKVIKVIRPGYNALTDTDPNHYIFHSDLNTFKIIKEGIVTINYTTNGIYDFNHNADISNPAVFMTFVKFPDGSVTMGNGTISASSRNNVWSIKFAINSTVIRSNIFGNGNQATIYIKYYIFETPLI